MPSVSTWAPSADGHPFRRSTTMGPPIERVPYLKLLLMLMLALELVLEPMAELELVMVRVLL